MSAETVMNPMQLYSDDSSDELEDEMKFLFTIRCSPLFIHFFKPIFSISCHQFVTEKLLSICWKKTKSFER